MGIWKGDVLVADIYSKRFNAKEVIFPKENGKFIFPVADGRIKPLEEIKTWEHPFWYDSDQFKEKVTLIFLENQKDLFHHLTTRFRMPVKQLMTFGSCQKISYTAITLNPESSFIRREKNHSQFHWNTLTSPELHSIYFIGRKTSTRICVVRGERLTRKRLTSSPDHLWPEFWEKWERMPSWRRSKSVRLNSSILITHEIARDLFHWPGGQGIQRDYQKCSYEIGNTSFSCYALQDYEEQ